MEKALVLPDLSTAEILVEVKDQEFNQFLVSCQKLSGYMNRPVPNEKLVEHPIVKGVFYLPISYMEAMLDTVFFGLWKTTNFHTQLISNELIGSIELHIFHPYLKEWITRTGAGALQIMVDSIPDKQKKEMTPQQRNSWALNPENKKPGALSNGGFAHLKADCFKNACLSIGTLFGRDVNREHTTGFMPLVEPIKETILKLRKKISSLFEHYQDEESKQKIIKKITDAEDTNKNTVEFYQQIIKEIEGK